VNEELLSQFVSLALGLLVWLITAICQSVSRNRTPKMLGPSIQHKQTGPKWEQDEPYALALLDEEDDW